MSHAARAQRAGACAPFAQRCSINRDVVAVHASTVRTVQASVFSEFKIESKMGDVIYIEVLLPNLLHALRGCTTAPATTLKLTKRGVSPFLTILTQVCAVHTVACVQQARCEGNLCAAHRDKRKAAHVRKHLHFRHRTALRLDGTHVQYFHGLQTVEGGVLIVQDVPVRVLASTEIERYAEPTIPEPPVRLLRLPRAQLAHTYMYTPSACVPALNVASTRDALVLSAWLLCTSADTIAVQQRKARGSRCGAHERHQQDLAH
ncbi:MAG: hypothetical protein EOO65_01010 [Methanosarcinales archaeon]|nr:MAG: hypothetical protein EOO65_01010 [Methanosarcinales archaeon]